MTDSSPSARHALNGSCHCGALRYIVFLTLPHPHPGGQAPPRGSQRFYRCNCTICHKAGFFHVRVASSADDFLLLAPLDPLADLGDYLWQKKRLHFLYCRTCATRCFIFVGDGEVVDVDLAQLGVAGETAEPGNRTRVWRVKRDGAHPDYGTYLSVNGNTIDAGQAFDMRELTDKKIVQYYDYLHDDAAAGRYDRPHPGGCY
ncbi:DUF636 domain-containing protein [Tolypocladium paradoxum]|uniref:DUF636 domain-containing protein n=1 Tax=Tolypocladium paradoxum TaxID=94208 RepID=A0A2S4KPT7_9HYPO|nr:DUF636 domain-containing protein [Tolypocladium paradoxum]